MAYPFTNRDDGIASSPISFELSCSIARPGHANGFYPCWRSKKCNASIKVPFYSSSYIARFPQSALIVREIYERIIAPEAAKYSLPDVDICCLFLFDRKYHTEVRRATMPAQAHGTWQFKLCIELPIQPAK
jgi:hypothetical protein